MIVYKTTNLLNGKFYIGRDLYNDPNYLGSGKLLKAAIKKYGIENFKKEILEICSSNEQLNEREIYWIQHLDATSIGYNIALGGSGGDTITNNPNKLEIAKNQSKLMKGLPKSEEHKNNISIAKKGKPGKAPILTKESREKMSNSKLGKPLSESHKEKLKESAKNRKKPDQPVKWSDEAKEKRKQTYKENGHPRSIKIEVIDVEGNSVMFNSAREAAKTLNCSVHRILNNNLQNYTINKK